MALFGKKKEVPTPAAPGPGGATSDGTTTATSDSSDMSGFVPEPEKARKWFTHARTALESTNYEYAIHCFANGIKFDPEDMSAHRDMYEAAIKFRTKGGKPASGKEIRAIDGPHPVARMAAAEFAWMRDCMNPSLGLRLLERAVKAQQFEFGRWLAPNILRLLRTQKKPSKGEFVAAMRAFASLSAWEQAIDAGETATRLDPADAALAQETKNLAAQRAMDQGGYAQAGGAEGGFRKFVKDADRQRELDESETLSGAGSADERNLQRAKTAYEQNPLNGENIQKYAQLLRRMATPQSEEEAYQLYMKGFRDTKEFRFRMFAADIKINQADRNIRDLEHKVAASPDDEELKAKLRDAQRDLLTYKSAEFAEREVRYPTDRNIKFQRAEVDFALGKFDTAMSSYQQAKDEPRLRVPAGHRLGLCFAAEGWHAEAIQEFKDALHAMDATNRDRELDVRYDLMVSLIAHARAEKSVDFAKEALEICSGIARKDITYRDIRGRRKEIDELIKELSA